MHQDKPGKSPSREPDLWDYLVQKNAGSIRNPEEQRLREHDQDPEQGDHNDDGNCAWLFVMVWPGPGSREPLEWGFQRLNEHLDEILRPLSIRQCRPNPGTTLMLTMASAQDVLDMLKSAGFLRSDDQLLVGTATDEWLAIHTYRPMECRD